MEEREKIARLQEMVDQSHSIVFFGGAGVSTESGRNRCPGLCSSMGLSPFNPYFSIKSIPYFACVDKR